MFFLVQAVYIVLFGSILFCHEIHQFYPLHTVDTIVKRNFGFLFKPVGKGVFMIFIAFLNFGLTVNTKLGLSTGICLSIVGVGYIYFYLKSPEIFDKQSSSGSASLPPYVPQNNV
jgi:hypothetical protein